jgi:hypothetical protein
MVEIMLITTWAMNAEEIFVDGQMVLFIGGIIVRKGNELK